MHKRKHCYTVEQSRSQGGYAHLHLTILELGRAFAPDYSAEIKFQLHGDDAKHELRSWYGMHVTINTRNCRDANELGKLVGKIEKLVEAREGDWNLRDMTPANILWALEQMRIPRAVYDPRTSLYVPVGSVQDASYRRYSNKIDSVLARDESQAVRLLAEKTLAYSLASLEKWMTEGKPVYMSDDCAPTIAPIEFLLRNPFAPVESETVAS